LVFGSANTIVGTSGRDTISGQDGDDVITGGDGNDVLNGNNGNDTFRFTNQQFDGTDTIVGGAGNDAIAITDNAVIDDAKRSLQVSWMLGSGHAATPQLSRAGGCKAPCRPNRRWAAHSGDRS